MQLIDSSYHCSSIFKLGCVLRVKVVQSLHLKCRLNELETYQNDRRLSYPLPPDSSLGVCLYLCLSVCVRAYVCVCVCVGRFIYFQDKYD